MPEFAINDFEWFLALAREKSFTRTAAKLGVAQSTLSHAIRQLEARMGMQLFARTTRSVGLTDAGQRLVDMLTPRIEGIRADLAALMADRDQPTGTVRITLSDHALDWVVWPRISSLLRNFPDIKVELMVDSGLRNIVEDGFDAGVRLGESLEKDMIAVRISPDWRLLTVASPTYFASRPRPQNPRDLIGHSCINYRHTPNSGLYAWEFARDGQDIRVRVDGPLAVNSSAAAVRAAIQGHGIAYVPQDLVSAAILNGNLEAVLQDWCPTFSGYHLYFPARSQTFPALAAVVGALRWRPT